VLGMLKRTALPLVLLLAGSSMALGKAKREKAKPAEPTPAADEAAPEEQKPRFHPTVGPKKVDLGHELDIDLPAGMLFLDRKEGREVMENSGNRVNDDHFLGLVLPQAGSWLVTVNYVEEGYVKDDDAADFKANDILEGMREGLPEQNEYRKERGFKPLTLDGWTESPRYERGPHHLVWGLKVSDTESSTINFYTRVLGRRGYVAFNLLDDPAKIESSKQEALAVLKATTFRSGARYEDFDKKSDKVAEYGLAALVAGGAGVTALKLAKIGLLAKFGGKLLALLIALKKGIVVLVLALGAGIKRLLARITGRKQEVAVAPPPPPADTPPQP
jgi:uncharacterized membrane-anchored protein